MSSESSSTTPSSTATPSTSSSHNVQPPSRMNIVHNNVQLVDINSIKRPVFPELDFCKVESLMETIETDYDKVPALEALRAPNGDLFVFGGCHRYEAHKRLGKDKIKVNIRDAPLSIIQMYLGASYQ